MPIRCTLTRRQPGAALAAASLWRGAGAQAPRAASAPAQAPSPAPMRLPVQAFFHPPHLSQALLNPAGTRVALVVGGDGAHFRLVDLNPGALLTQGPQTGPHVLTMRPQDLSEGLGFFQLLRWNTLTGSLEELDVPPWSTAFLIGPDGEPAAARTVRGPHARVVWRLGSQWRTVHETDR